MTATITLVDPTPYAITAGWVVMSLGIFYILFLTILRPHLGHTDKTHRALLTLSTLMAAAGLITLLVLS